MIAAVRTRQEDVTKVVRRRGSDTHDARRTEQLSSIEGADHCMRIVGYIKYLSDSAVTSEIVVPSIDQSTTSHTFPSICLPSSLAFDRGTLLRLQLAIFQPQQNEPADYLLHAGTALPCYKFR